MKVKPRYLKTKKEANYLLYRIYRHMNGDESATIRFMKVLGRRFLGYAFEDENLTMLNPDSDIIVTFLHEEIHHALNDWDESRVEKMAKELFFWMSDRQLENLFVKMAFLIRSEPFSGSRLKKLFAEATRKKSHKTGTKLK